MWQECKDLQDYIVGIRRDLHQIPELGFDLPQTQAYICAELDRLGIAYKKNRGDSGIIGEIKGGCPGKTVLLRADIDALPIKEDTGLPFSSRHEGKMHACGHDTHAAMLLGALRVLQEHRGELKGNVKFVFQTAEEISKGSQVAIKEGVMEGVDAVFGIHIGSILGGTLPSGTLSVIPGCCMASFDRFAVTVKGNGCHGSTPEKGIDPITIAANIVLSLQEIVAREIAGTKPSVLTIGMINGGFAYNVIPSEVRIEGTIRAIEEPVRQQLAKRIEEISQNIAAAFRGSVDFLMDWGAPPVINDEAMSALAAEAARKVLGDENVRTSQEAPNMGGEDFAYYLAEKPGAFMFLSSADHAKHTDVPHHNPKFMVDEDVFYKGSAVFVSIVEDYLCR
ncbi:M20 metallopeptidase family protein [Cloacibacillus evryensis]|uniref:M20 family metallopeptidase n=1 Tax=Cloacibacillus evryensis TaxID=508460 RepID=A0AAW5K2H2_9BACT|nr:M20 family metallopeptidase [Cloacibacillus evryensis]EHL64470.1 amidohydrolase [Synergistes sp. 3_1_syn1]MCQ4764695.1 M20 family metallopeptidase [Cloacibacillus evryensis]MCQ4813901.1 M20 family metallopeptidase [Cloacibacillus evryensis]